ncbi:MAG TPA: tetratricopeptide repeat protein [Armatimonadota bacterium]|jgi:tetratricopeptide (TPR) repeat protein
MAHRRSGNSVLTVVAIVIGLSVTAIIVDTVGSLFAESRWIAGHDAYMTGDNVRAERLFRQARHIWFRGGSRYWHGAALYQLGHYREALQAFDDTRSAQDLIDIGVTWLAMGEPGRGADALERAVKMDPSSAVFHHNYGIALSQVGRHRVARSERERARKIDPVRSATWRGPQILPIPNRRR